MVYPLFFERKEELRFRFPHEQTLKKYLECNCLGAGLYVNGLIEKPVWKPLETFDSFGLREVSPSELLIPSAKHLGKMVRVDYDNSRQDYHVGVLEYIRGERGKNEDIVFSKWGEYGYVSMQLNFFLKCLQKKDFRLFRVEEDS